MSRIFEEGSFNDYKNVSLNEAKGIVYDSVKYAGVKKTTVFISHSHDDLNDLKGIIGFLEKEYGVKAYIDSEDPTMPRKTSPETASNIKERIQQCDKFILLATEKAIASKWCNWELGFGDAEKTQNQNIAIFPLKPKGSYDSNYKGNEYLGIYPYIVRSDGTEQFSNGEYIKKGLYYVRTCNGVRYYTVLVDWFKQV